MYWDHIRQGYFMYPNGTLLLECPRLYDTVVMTEDISSFYKDARVRQIYYASIRELCENQTLLDTMAQTLSEEWSVRIMVNHRFYAILNTLID